MSYLYVKWNSFGLGFARRRFRHYSMVCLALATPANEDLRRRRRRA
jgi:hypothetical protein